MKIIFLAISSLSGIYDYRFLKKLNEKNYKVKCVIFSKEKVIIEKKYKDLTNIEYINYLPCLKIYNILGPLNLLYKIVQLRKLIKQFKPDILHCSYVSKEGWLGALSGFHPFVLMPVGTDILIDPFNSFKTFLKNRFSIRRADFITCDSKYQKEFAVKVGNIIPEKVITFPWGIELEIFYPRRNNQLRDKLGWSNKTVIIRNRNLFDVYGKDLYGHKDFIEAFRIAYKKNNNLRVLLIGNGNMKNYVVEELSKIDRECFYWFDLCNPETMAEYLNAADIYVNTSYSDGASCSMLEAMACGIPVITTDIFVNYEWIKDYINGFITEKGNIGILSEKILYLSENKELSLKMGRNNRDLAEQKADWNKNFQVLEEIYKKLKG